MLFDYIVSNGFVELTFRDMLMTKKLTVASFSFFLRNSDVLSRVVICVVTPSLQAEIVQVRSARVLPYAYFSSRS